LMKDKYRLALIADDVWSVLGERQPLV